MPTLTPPSTHGDQIWTSFFYFVFKKNQALSGDK